VPPAPQLSRGGFTRRALLKRVSTRREEIGILPVVARRVVRNRIAIGAGNRGLQTKWC
jgi:hypothetical protein